MKLKEYNTANNIFASYDVPTRPTKNYDYLETRTVASVA